MSIESMLTGLFAAKTHKLHWREWPAWDQLDEPQLSTFLRGRGYDVHGFSYLLNAEHWMPGILCYKPELYRDFPSHKRDTHSHHAVLAAVKHYFAHDFKPGRPQCLMIHSIFVFDFWDEMMALFAQHGLTEANTVFAFTSDHYFPKNFGRQWLLGERDGSSIWHHTDLTEYNTRVFLYLKYPDIRPREIGDAIAGYDLTPTLLELLGLRAEWPGRLDGESLLPLLGGEMRAARRTLRNDNVYPYQIGEKQGRIAAVRCGRFKYVRRPDPASSYISYRMHEPWSAVLGHEELYDIEADPEEQRNLVNSTEPAVLGALAHCRAEMKRTSDEIIDFHVESLKLFAERSGLAARLGSGKSPRRILCFQSCPVEVCATLVRLLAGLLPEADIEVVAKDLAGWALPGRCRVVAQPGEGYDCALRLSNFPVGAYTAVYDATAHPIGDFTAVGAAIRALPVAAKFTLGLDCSLTPVTPDEGPGLGDRARAAVRSMVAWAEPSLRRWAKKFKSGSGASMPRHLSERIIRDDRTD